MTGLLAFLTLALAQEADDEKGSRASASLSDDFEIRYYQIPDRLADPNDVPVLNYVEQVNRLNASASFGDWTLEGQVDEVALFANQYLLDGEPVVERQLLVDDMYAPFYSNDPDQLNTFGYANLEKIRLRVEKPKYSMVFGDTYAAFGRGIALNLNRNVDIDVDTSIQGFKGVFRPGAWDVIVVAGQLNRQQVFQDNPNTEIVGDRRHAVAGVRVERFGLGPANIGGHVVTYDFVEHNGWWGRNGPVQIGPSPVPDGPEGDNAGTRGFDEALSPVDAVVLGSTLELSGVGGIDWFGEGDLFAFPSHCEGDPTAGPFSKDRWTETYRYGAGRPDGCEPVLPNFLAAERSLLLYDYGTAARPRDFGYATYLSASFYPGKTTWLVELKRYYQAERVNSLLATEFYEVAIAPTAEYELAVGEDTSAALNSNDIYGGRIRVDYTAKPGELVPYVALGAYRDEDVTNLHFNQVPETIVHPVIGVEYIKHKGAAIINAGYRTDIRDSNAERAAPLVELFGRDRNIPGLDSCDDPEAPDFLCAPGADKQLHGDFSIKFPMLAGLTGEVQGTFQYWQWGQNLIQQRDFVQTTAGFTVQRGSDLAVTLYNDFTNNPLIDSTGNLPIQVGGEEPLYGAVEVMVKPTSAITMKAFYGAYKAGIRCSGGQCRQLPGFQGGRLGVQGAF